MGMKQIQQITDLLSTPKGEFIVNCWEHLIFSSTYGKTYKAVNIRRLELDIDINFNPDSLLAKLSDYFEKIDGDAAAFQNEVCKKGCCDCCTNDFEISASEYFMLLRYMDIKFGKEFIQKITQKARISFNSPNCIFVNNTDGACTVYEARPLICRKYGLYGDLTDCKKLKSDKIVYWFANMENVLSLTNKMNALYKASITKNLNFYIEMLMC